MNDLVDKLVFPNSTQLYKEVDVFLLRFGQVPTGLRSYVGGALATKASGCSAGSGGDFIQFKGGSHWFIIIYTYN